MIPPSIQPSPPSNYPIKHQNHLINLCVVVAAIRCQYTTTAMSSHVANRLTCRIHIVILTSQFDGAHKNTKKGGVAYGGRYFQSSGHGKAPTKSSPQCTFLAWSPASSYFYLLPAPYRSDVTTTDAVNKALMCQLPQFDINKRI